MMIQIITLIISLIIQFGTVFPIDYTGVNDQYADITDRLYNDVVSRGFSFDKKYCLIVGETSNFGAGYEVFVPLEVLNSSNSTISATYRNDYHINTINTGWIRFKYGSSFNFLFGGYNEVANSLSFDLLGVGISENGAGKLLYNEYYVLSYNDVDSFSFSSPLPPLPSFDGHYEPTDAPENLDFAGHSNVNITTSNITTENGNIIQNILGKMNNAINSLGNIVASGFNGVYSLLGQINNNIGSVFGNLFGKISYILYIPSADEIIATFNSSLLGQNLHLFGDVENSVRDNLIITTPDNFVINFSFMFFGNNIPFVLDMNGLFGSVLMSRLRSILTAFIYVGCVLLVIHELPHTIQGLNGFGR